MTIDRIELGRRLASIRQAAGTTQQQLADAVGVDRVTVARWESGNRTPDLIQLGLIADAIGQRPATVARKLFDFSS
jgi:transcriptional regulator with XRE-family HTH domain